MTAAQTEAEWIDWAGGECPVLGDTVVECKFGSGGDELDTGPAGQWGWQRSLSGWDCHIIAYRVVVSQ